MVGLQRAGTSSAEKLVKVRKHLIETLHMVGGMYDVWQIVHGCDKVGGGAVAAPKRPDPKQACICCITGQALEVHQVHNSPLNILCYSYQSAKYDLHLVLLLL